MSESIERIKAYSKRRKAAKAIDIEHIHSFDVSPDGGFELLLSDVDGAIARIEHLERVLAQAREAFDSAVNSARLLGATQAKQGFGAYTELDARFETAMHQSIATHRRTIVAIDEALKS